MPAAFFTSVVALSIPLWILGALSQSELRNLLPFNLPISALALLSYAAMRAMGRSLPEANLSFTDAALLIVPFVISAFGEELGWQGYAFDPLAGRLGVRLAAVVLALFWASWHAIPFVETGHDAIGSSGKRLPRRACAR